MTNFNLSPALTRRPLLAGALLAWGGAASAPVAPLPRRPLVFPADHGSHNDTQTEWWYVTGHLQAKAGLYGFQVTFFRSRVASTQALRSSLAAKHIVFAHAAVTDLAGARLLHDERMARWSGEWPQINAGASSADTDVVLRNWRLRREPQSADASSYQTVIHAKDFHLNLRLQATQPLLLQGEAGWSAKGPEPQQASRYYSLPQLQASGELQLNGLPAQAVQGRAWLDHEWSNALLHPSAIGWDWVGMNLFDGSSLTAFQVRTASGLALWSGGSMRAASGPARMAKPGDMVFTAGAKTHQSASTGAVYPLVWTLRTPIATFLVRAMLPNQELDSRQSTGTAYWEGLSELVDANGQVVGRGYLEMTGYAGRVRF